MERVCFLLHLKPDRVQDYLAAHETAWEEVLDALRETGWTNYSLFVRPEDGLVVGYLETEDFPRALAGMASKEVNERWQSEMAQYFSGLQGRPDQGLEMLSEYFHLA